MQGFTDSRVSATVGNGGRRSGSGQLALFTIEEPADREVPKVSFTPTT